MKSIYGYVRNHASTSALVGVVVAAALLVVAVGAYAHAEDMTPIFQTASSTCPFTFEPVCGTNGTTYPNQCFASSSNVTVAHDGRCTIMESSSSDDDIIGYPSEPLPTPNFDASNTRQFDLPIFSSNTIASTSIHLWNPTDRTDQPLSFAPGFSCLASSSVSLVCGTDGRTYPNKCFADWFKTTVASQGACAAAPQPVTDLPVDIGNFTKQGNFLLDVTVTNADGTTSTQEKAVQIGTSHRRTDFNNDCKIDVQDLGITLSNWGKDAPLEDVDNSGSVDVRDLGTLLSNWEATSTASCVPN